MSTRKTIMCMAGFAFIAPLTVTRILWGKQAPNDFYEPTVAAWFATILEEVDRFGETADDWLRDHPCL